MSKKMNWKHKGVVGFVTTVCLSKEGGNSSHLELFVGLFSYIFKVDDGVLEQRLSNNICSKRPKGYLDFEILEIHQEL